MNEPYQTPSGISYEKEALQEYIDKNEPKDPITSETFNSFDDCSPNTAMNESIKNLLKHNPEMYDFYESSNDWCDIKFTE